MLHHMLQHVLDRLRQQVQRDPLQSEQAISATTRHVLPTQELKSQLPGPNDVWSPTLQQQQGHSLYLIKSPLKEC
jgi:hypothetical protein